MARRAEVLGAGRVFSIENDAPLYPRIASSGWGVPGRAPCPVTPTPSPPKEGGGGGLGPSRGVPGPTPWATPQKGGYPPKKGLDPQKGVWGPFGGDSPKSRFLALFWGPWGTPKIGQKTRILVAMPVTCYPLFGLF